MAMVIAIANSSRAIYYSLLILSPLMFATMSTSGGSLYLLTFHPSSLQTALHLKKEIISRRRLSLLPIFKQVCFISMTG
jgi:hypothetical protein